MIIESFRQVFVKIWRQSFFSRWAFTAICKLFRWDFSKISLSNVRPFSSFFVKFLSLANFRPLSSTFDLSRQIFIDVLRLPSSFVMFPSGLLDIRCRSTIFAKRPHINGKPSYQYHTQTSQLISWVIPTGWQYSTFRNFHNHPRTPTTVSQFEQTKE